MIRTAHNVQASILKAALSSPLALPEGVLTIGEDDVIEDMQPLHFTVHAHHKPTGTIAHMLGFQLPDCEYDFEGVDNIFEECCTGLAGVGVGEWHEQMVGETDYGGLRFEIPDWLCSIQANFGSFTSRDQLMVKATMEFDDHHRLKSIDCVPCRRGDQDEGYGPAPWWEVPMSMADMPGVCRALKWA